MNRVRRVWLRVGLVTPLVVAAAIQGCAGSAPIDDGLTSLDSATVVAEVEARVWAFHTADTARAAEAVIALLWPDYEMLVDGERTGYDEVVAGSREFMPRLDVFHTVWTDLRIIPVNLNAAVSSFQFRDSILTHAGELIQSRGPTTFLWERRDGEWRIRFGDADHYPIQ